MVLPQLPGFGGLNEAGASAGVSEQEAATVKAIQAGMESCAVKTVLSGGMGFGLGALFGLLMSSMSYDTPMGGASQQLANLPLKEQLRKGFKDMGFRSFSSAKNFGTVGALFAGTECCIEGFRARHDIMNSISAGCITGGALGARAGPQASAIGCAGFAAFSAAIDTYMNSGD